MCKGYGPVCVHFLCFCLCMAAGSFVQILTGSDLCLVFYIVGPLIVFGCHICYLCHCHDFDGEIEAEETEAERESNQNEYRSVRRDTRPSRQDTFPPSTDQYLSVSNLMRIHENSSSSSNNPIGPMNSVYLNIENSKIEQDTRRESISRPRSGLTVSIPPEISVQNPQDIVHDTGNAVSDDNLPKYEDLYPQRSRSHLKLNYNANKY